jgi:hypothetical protein
MAWAQTLGGLDFHVAGDGGYSHRESVTAQEKEIVDFLILW